MGISQVFGTAVCQCQGLFVLYPLVSVCLLSQTPLWTQVASHRCQMGLASVSYGNHRSQCGLMDRTRFYTPCTTPKCSSCNRRWLIQFLDGSLLHKLPYCRRLCVYSWQLGLCWWLLIQKMKWTKVDPSHWSHSLLFFSMIISTWCELKNSGWEMEGFVGRL